MADVRDVAKYLLHIAAVDEDSLTNMKLQKLLYYCQGFYLAIYDKPLFAAKIEKWTHGPVCPVVYQEYKKHKANIIPGPADSFNRSRLSSEEREVIKQVYSTYGQFSAWRLRDLTHKEAPWVETPDSGEISTTFLKEFFKTKLA